MNKIINFGKFETASFLANVFIIKIFLGLPGELARASGTAAWMVALLSGALFLGILFFIFKIYEENEEHDIIILSEKTGGKAFKAVFALLVSVSFPIKAALALRVTSEIIVTVLPFDLSLNTCLVLLVFAMLLCASFGLEGVVRLHAVFLPLVLAAFAFAVISGLAAGDVTNLCPVFGLGGKNIALNSIKYIGIYSDIIYVFLLAPHVKNKKIYKKACLGGTALAVLVVLAVSLSYGLAVEYPENTKLFMPIYQVSRLMKTGANSQGFEAFLLPEWIISSLLYLTASAYFAADVFKKAFKLKCERLIVLIVSLIIYLLSLLPKNLEEASLVGLKAVNPFVIFISVAAFLVALKAKIKSRRKVC